MLKCSCGKCDKKSSSIGMTCGKRMRLEVFSSTKTKYFLYDYVLF